MFRCGQIGNLEINDPRAVPLSIDDFFDGRPHCLLDYIGERDLGDPDLVVFLKPTHIRSGGNCEMHFADEVSVVAPTDIVSRECARFAGARYADAPPN